MPSAASIINRNRQKTLRRFRCDLHVHTCLSPCAELDMYPGAVVAKALEEKIDILAISDHNSSENVRFVMEAAAGKPIKIIPGMEITSEEEVHLLALFNTLSELCKIQEIVYAHLPGTNREEIFGCQAIVNGEGEVEGFNERFLLGATRLPLTEIVRQVHALGGVAVAAHIDRPSFSVISQLGFVDPEVPFDALEVSRSLGIAKGRLKYPELASYRFLTSSDAHLLKDIGRGITEMMLENPSFDELKRALKGQNGRATIEE